MYYKSLGLRFFWPGLSGTLVQFAIALNLVDSHRILIEFLSDSDCALDVLEHREWIPTKACPVYETEYHGFCKDFKGFWETVSFPGRGKWRIWFHRVHRT